MEDFWKRCVDAGCVIVPIKTYSQWGADGNHSEEFFTGIKFAALEFRNEAAVGPDYWFILEEQCDRSENLHASPLEALAAWEAMTRW